MSLDTLFESDRTKVKKGEEEIGYGWVEPKKFGRILDPDGRKIYSQPVKFTWTGR
jgi:hypothetical protein